MPKLYWITGLSGAGKTTIGKFFFEKIKEEEPAAVFLDGDALRNVFGGVFGYSEEERRKCARCYSELGKLLVEQGITVVLCTVSMFHEVRQWNRENIPGYVEIYIKASLKTLQDRDQKGLYSRTSTEADKTVVGIDFQFEEPRTPDVVLENDGDIGPQKQAERLCEMIKSI